MDWGIAKDILGIVKDIATIVLPLAGVLVGAQLARRTANEQWLKKERLTAYLGLIKQLRDMNQRFAVGLRVSKFREDAAAHGHDFNGVTWAWQESMDELQDIEVSIRLLGGRLGKVYEESADGVIFDMLVAIDDDEITEEAWDELLACAGNLVEALEESAALDLQVPVAREPLLSLGLRRDRRSSVKV
ncbi:hypothetical protein [Paeniglutamicibacter cryotolerans]|uniref:Uncharacterized protein n=1 Tax=Paeniglutamicibacter cryotolerans TaxID=670079 RepID=A0A839QRV9_9MICC|nr:hypothetical protein [Paeniglutamicibacter cryotolerans]MBB2997514.1 hypothetical protein [Paeniglutamicibacter cryotolerans]